MKQQKNTDFAFWQELLKRKDERVWWHDQVVSIMKSYQVMAEGAMVIKREQTIEFNYKETDSEFGLWQAKEMKNYL